MTTSKQTIYVGTYTREKRTNGIYLFDLDVETGRLKRRGAVDGVEDPSFLAVGPGRRCLLAASEVAEFEGQPGGAVRAYAIDRETGDLTRLNGQPTHGDHPCYVSFDHSGRWAFAANYTGGSLTMFPVHESGLLGEPTVIVRHHGYGVKPEQDGPHVHSVQVDPDNRVLFVCDLGLDQIIAYPLDLTAGRLDTTAPAVMRTAAGAGPRHLCFHPSGRFVFVSNELNSTVGVYSLDGESHGLTELQTLSTLPEGTKQANDVADIHLSPDGRFLYVSNRGHDSLAGFAVDADSGMLTPIGHTKVRGRWPRNFGFDVTGRFVLVANQKSDSLTAFRYDAATGALETTGEQAEVPSPVCVIAVAF